MSHAQSGREESRADLSRELERLQGRVALLELARRKTEEALGKSEAMAQSIVNSALDAIVTIDEKRIIRAFNPAASSLFGYQIDEVVGKSATLLMPASHQTELDERLSAYIHQEKTQGASALIGTNREVVGRRKDGSLFPCEIAMSEMRIGSERMFTGIIRDRTEHKRIERELELKRAELERSNAELEQFAAVVSHDLQEPLRMVASYAQMLGNRYRHKLDAEGVEFISFMQGGVNQMKALIGGLLNYSRIGSRGRPLDWVECDAILDTTLRHLKLAIEENGAVIERGPLPRIKGDETQLIQLFQNLLANAIKFRNKQPPLIRVFAKTEAEGGWTFSVEDNGIGIEERHIGRLFHIFQTLHARSEYPGIGIGLAVCKKVVERHGGRIWVESRHGEGSKFCFTIPDPGPEP